ncbi:MAG TPA: hypothetical protein DE060_18210 [Lentisphaeria bacterium]|nr:hypothetical protein [Lentisphaeria bacterium]HCG51125.1 hypothetical protein [Lentisphaeria bacterium]
MKTTLFCCLALTLLSLSATETIIFRHRALPGGSIPPATARQEKVTLPECFQQAGTAALHVRPDGWDQQEKAWHFFLTAGKLGKTTPHIYLYRFPDGRLRLLWSLNTSAKQTGELIVPGVFEKNRWTHLAFTWETKDGHTDLKLYQNGRLAASRRVNFELGRNFPREWQIGDIPAWNPRSPHPTIMGRIELHPQALAPADIAALAALQMENGAVTLINRKFIPESVNRISGQVETDSSAQLRLEAVFVDEMGKTTAVDLAPRWTPFSGQIKFDAELRLPPDTVETRLTVRSGAGTSPVWKLEKIHYADWLPPVEPNYWKASWIWSGNTSEPEAHRYFVTHFEADPDQLSKVVFQGASDDRGTVYLNGKAAVKINGWAIPAVNENLKSLLVKGKNTLAVDAFNVGGGSGFLGELNLVGKDGNVTSIASGTDWKASERLTPGWNQPGFDVSGWTSATARLRPPQVPYGETAYRNFTSVPVLSRKTPFLKLTANAGETVKIQAIFNGAAPQNVETYLLLLRNHRELFRTPVRTTVNGSQLQVTGEIVLPPFAMSEEYQLKLESRSVRFCAQDKAQEGGIGTLKVKAAALPQPLRAEVRKKNGLPALYLNGVSVPPMLYRNAINTRNNTRSNRFMTGFDKAGIRLFEINLSLDKLWMPDGSVNTEELELYLLSAMYYAPNGKLVVFFNTDAPGWYVNKYPEERYFHTGGPVNRISYASERWRADSTAFLRKMIAFIRSRPYYHQIAGFGLDGGEDGQFMQWTGRNLNYLGDYSPAMKRYFRATLLKKYGTITALNQSWKRNYGSFEEIQIPSQERRKHSPEGFFLDPVKDADIIEFNRAFSDAVADTILSYAAAIKEETGREKIVAAYYGKFFSVAGYLEWGEMSIERIIASPELDYLIAVEYAQRGAGKPHSVSAPLASYALHNKIFVDEADLRTFLSGTRNWGYAGTFFETISMIRKMFIYTWSKGHGLHWYDLHGGAFDNQGILQAIANTRQIALKSPERRFIPAEIAVIVDEPSLLCTTTEVKKLTGRALLHLQNGNFGRMGADFDVYLLNDLQHPDFPGYKMYVFLNVWAPSPAAVESINRLKNNGRMLVWLYNSGLIANGTRSIENVSSLTGIKMSDAGSVPLAMGLENFGALPPQYTSACEAAPVAYPTDPQACLSGRFMKTPGKSPLALKKFPAWTSVYSAVPVLTPAVWRELARQAGVHIYTEDPDAMLYLGDGLLGIHTGQGGVKTIHWPRKAVFRDAVTGQVYGTRTARPEIPMLPNETKIIFVE